MNRSLPTKKEEMLADVIERLFSGDSPAEEAAFQELCTSWSDDEIVMVEEMLLKRANTRATHWRLRYFAAIETPLALGRLAAAAFGEDEILREEACLRIAKVSERACEDLLLQLLEAPYEREVCFAIQRIGELRLARAVEPLLAVWRTRLETPILIEILRAFRRIRDPRCLPPIERWFPTAQGGVAQSEALETLACYATELRPKFLQRCIVSPQRPVRQMVYKIITHFQGRRWSRMIADCLRREKDAVLRSSLLTSCRTLETRVLFKVILDFALKDPVPYVRLTAESTLKRMKSKRLLQWLFQDMPKKAGFERMVFYRLAADYYDQPNAVRFFLKLSRHTEASQKKMGFEFLRGLYSAGQRHFKNTKIKPGSDQALLVVQVMSASMNAGDWPLLAKFLETSQAQSTEILRHALYTLKHLPESLRVPEEIQETCLRLTEASDKEARYLAVRCLSRFPTEKSFLTALEKSRVDSNTAVRQAAMRSAGELIQKNPELLSRLMELTAVEKPYFSVCVRLLEQMTFTQGMFDSFLAHFLTCIIELEQNSKPGSQFLRLRIYYVLQLLAKQHPALFWKACTLTLWDDSRRLLLLGLLNKLDFKEREELDCSFMLALYPEASERTRIEMFFFMKQRFIRQPQVRQLVFDVIAQTQSEKEAEAARLTMKAWLTFDTAAHAEVSQSSGGAA